MPTTKIHLPTNVELYMEDCKETEGTPEWFQSVFNAIAQCATDNGEYIAEQAYDAFSNGFEDEDKIEEAIEEMKKKAGLESLC